MIFSTATTPQLAITATGNLIVVVGTAYIYTIRDRMWGQLTDVK